jgi:hypothetical protein
MEGRTMTEVNKEEITPAKPGRRPESGVAIEAFKIGQAMVDEREKIRKTQKNNSAETGKDFLIDYSDIKQNSTAMERLNRVPSKTTANFRKEPIAWACRTCNKIDWVDSKEQLAQPEHVSYRGVDIGNCVGKMVKLYDN